MGNGIREKSLIPTPQTEGLPRIAHKKHSPSIPLGGSSAMRKFEFRIVASV
jgi:hypothetical protein